MVSNYRATGLHPGLPASVEPISRSQQGAFQPDSREASDLLESLDDAMFAAIAGEATVMATARDLWAKAVRYLPSELVEESREQYLQFALDAARRLEVDGVRDPARVIVALEIIDLVSNRD